MSDNRLPSNTFNDGLALTLPEFKGLAAVSLNMDRVKEAERCIILAKDVNPSTYSHLENTFNDAYMDLKLHLATVGYQILRVENELEKARSIALLDKFPIFLEDKPKNMNNAAVRDAFIAQDPDVQVAKERLDSLKAISIFLEGRVRVMENVCRYMRKRMDLLIRAGAIDPNVFNTQK